LSMFFDTPAAGIETQKQLFQHVLDKLDQIVILTRRVGDELRIVYANPNVAQLGYNAEELVGAPFNFFGDTAAKASATSSDICPIFSTPGPASLNRLVRDAAFE